LIVTYHYYSRKLAKELNAVLDPKETMRQLLPESTLLRLDESYYYAHLIV